MIGFTSTTFRPYSVDKVIDFAIKAKVDCVEWGGDIHVKDIAKAMEVKEKCDKVNLPISSYGSYYRVGSNDAEYWLNICEIASKLGAKSIRVWLGIKGSEKTSNEEFENLVADGIRMADVAKSYGLIVSSECHPNTYNDTTESSIKFLEAVNKDNFKTYFQSLYCNISKDIDRLKKILPYVLNVHISYSEMERNQLFRKKNKTCVDQILSVLKENNFQGIIMLEYVRFFKFKNFVTDIKRLKSFWNE
jgi:sugar phosphate isomerase/epimerase